MRVIKAAVCHAFDEDLIVEDVAIRSPLANEVEVELDAVAICHSDISFATGAWVGELPAVYGHEAAGHVRELGQNVCGLNVGDPVVVTLIRACGTCIACATGNPVSCESPPDSDNTPLRSMSDEPIVQGMNCAAFAERVVVHHSQVVRVSPELAMEEACLLACGVITGVGAVVNAANLRAGQDVVVVGAGGVGLNAIQGARIAGARRIIAVDMTPEKLAVARDFGATDGVIATDRKRWQQVHSILGRGADAVFVTVGNAKSYDEALIYLGPKGKVVIVGLPPTGALSSYEASNIAANGQSLIGSKMGDVVLKRDIPWLEDLYQQERLKLSELISGRWTLEQINDAIADTLSGDAKRNVIVLR